VFIAAIILIACAIIGGLAWVCRHTGQGHETTPSKSHWCLIGGNFSLRDDLGASRSSAPRRLEQTDNVA
jgi:hypothetical protein